MFLHTVLGMARQKEAHLDPVSGNDDSPYAPSQMLLSHGSFAGITLEQRVAMNAVVRSTMSVRKSTDSI